jgi:hypothetical protein
MIPHEQPHRQTNSSFLGDGLASHIEAEAAEATVVANRIADAAPDASPQ